MRALPRAQYAWRPWDVFFAQIEGDGQSLFCLMSISLLFYPLTPFVPNSELLAGICGDCGGYYPFLFVPFVTGETEKLE